MEPNNFVPQSNPQFVPSSVQRPVQPQVQTQVQPPAPGQVLPASSHKGMRVIVLVVAVLVIAATGYFAYKLDIFSAANDAKGEWLTYTDPSGFEIQYPSNWVVGEKVLRENGEPLYMGIHPIKNQKPPVTQILFSFGPCTVDSERLGWKSTGLSTGLGSEFCMPDKNMTVNLYTKNEKDKPLTEQIYSTLKFTDETAGWQTYVNTKYSYSIKYPPEYATEIPCMGIECPPAGLDSDEMYFHKNGIIGLSIKRYNGFLNAWLKEKIDDKNNSRKNLTVTTDKISGFDVIKISYTEHATISPEPDEAQIMGIILSDAKEPHILEVYVYRIDPVLDKMLKSFSINAPVN